MFDIKVRLAKLELTQTWLIRELDKRGVRVDSSQLSKYRSGLLKTPKSQKVLSLCNEILTEQEKGANSNGKNRLPQ